MIHHCKAVSRGNKNCFTIGDMPFGSYQVSKELALQNALRFVKEGQMEAVKLEGGSEQVADTIKRIVTAGIPVMGHVGLTPQSHVALGGYRVQGKTADKAIKLVDEAKRLQEAGCFSIVLEAIPDPIAKYITESLDIFTIGIGAGKHCSGQVLVQQDMLGSFDKFLPKFCKLYDNLNNSVTAAIKNYVSEVRHGRFPAREHTYAMNDEELAMFKKAMEEKSETDSK